MTKQPPWHPDMEDEQEEQEASDCANRTYLFRPLEDITAYEVAAFLEPLGLTISHAGLEQMAPEMQRHWALLQAPPKYLN